MFSVSFNLSASAIYSELLTPVDFNKVHIKSLLRVTLKKKSEEILNSIRWFRLDDSVFQICSYSCDMNVFLDSDILLPRSVLPPQTMRVPIKVVCSYFKIKYDKIKKRRGYKRTHNCFLARMTAIYLYHIFKDLKDFHPPDYEELMTSNPPKPRKQNIQSALELLQSSGYEVTPAMAAS